MGKFNSCKNFRASGLLGSTVNFKAYRKSYKLKKKMKNDHHNGKFL